MMPPDPRRWFLLFALGFSVAGLPAAPVTEDRVSTLSPAEQSPWRDYLLRSVAAARADQAVVDEEARVAGLALPLRAPESGGDFKLTEKVDASWYATPEAGKTADAILSFQTPTGGWSKHTDYSQGPRRPGMQWTSQSDPGKRARYVGTFDNDSTTAQIRFLALVWQATGREDCKAGALRGVDYVLAAQYPSGGWPQIYPLIGGYHDDITFNDDAMTHVLELLRDVVDGAPAFALLDAERRARAERALAAGVACVLRMQIVIEGKKTVWCAQHDAMTLAPTAARAMEPASFSGLESAHILKFLMTLRRPSPEAVAAIEAGLAWLENARVTGIAKRKEGGRTVYAADPASAEVYWARFYDFETGRPIFPGRDGVIYESYESMIAKNAGGYDYYTTLPGSVLRNGQKQWRKRLAAAGG